MQESEGGDFVGSGMVHDAFLLASCIYCGRLHQADDPLEFDPICATCARRYPSGSLDMSGSYPLTNESIDAMVLHTSPGNYALGFMDGITFMVFYVGRSDSDVKHRLHAWVGTPSRYKRYAPSAKAACRSRHRQGLPRSPTLDRVGNVDSRYTRFAFSYAASARAAFEKECRNYHDFGGSDGLDNQGHPESPPGSPGECVVHRQ